MPGPQGGGGWVLTPGSKEGGAGLLDSWVWGQKRPGVQILGPREKDKDDGLDSWVLGGGRGRSWGLKWVSGSGVGRRQGLESHS